MEQIHFLVFHAENEEEARNKLMEFVSQWQEANNMAVSTLGLLREGGSVVFDNKLPPEIAEGGISAANEMIANEIKKTGQPESETGQGFRRVCAGSRDISDLRLAYQFCEELVDLAELEEIEGDFDILTHVFRDYRFHKTGVSNLVLSDKSPLWIGVVGNEATW